MLDELGISGQARILDSRVLIIGAGGLGCPAALYLAGAGVGQFTLADPDIIDLTNLQRQIAHTNARLGMIKVESLRLSMLSLNPKIEVLALTEKISGLRLDELVQGHDVILDCSDNFATRYAVNQACVQHRKPLVSGSAIQWHGQICVFDFRQPDSACYHCLFPDGDELEETRCATTGVFAPLTGIIGCLQAAEALKLITGAGRTLHGRLLLFNAASSNWREISVVKDTSCTVCSR